MTKIYEHCYDVVKKSLALYTKYELESLCAAIEVQLRQKQNDNNLNNISFPYEWAEMVTLDYNLNVSEAGEGDKSI